MTKKRNEHGIDLRGRIEGIEESPKAGPSPAAESGLLWGPVILKKISWAKLLKRRGTLAIRARGAPQAFITWLPYPPARQVIQMSYLRGLKYQIEKKEEGRPNGKLGQNDPVERTSAKLAKEFGVSEKTIRRDAKFAEAIDKLPEKDMKGIYMFGRNREEEKKIRTHLNAIDEIEVKGSYRPVYRIGTVEYKTLPDAIRDLLADYQSALASSHSDPDEKFSRKRTRAEIQTMADEIIDGINSAYRSKFSSILAEDGPFREALHSPASFDMERNLNAAREDLQERLLRAAGGEFQLMLMAALFPEVLKSAIETIPEGQTLDQVFSEDKRTREDSRVFNLSRIREAEEYLREVLKKEQGK